MNTRFVQNWVPARKTPKIYFTDVGTLCWLSGLRDASHAQAGPLGGAIFETAVVTEVAKTLYHRGEEPALYFWRTSNGAEVDLIIESQGRLIPLEVKLSSTPNPRMIGGLRAFREAFGDHSDAGFVVHPGSSRLPLGSGVRALPYQSL